LRLGAKTAVGVTLALSLAGCSQLPLLSAKVPDVTGFETQAATEILEGEGFEVRRTVTNGSLICQVIKQVPDGGERAEKGSAVQLAEDCQSPLAPAQ
jgi:beta-lactam-binding protein with PASTA domain